MAKLSYFRKIVPATVLAVFSFFGAYNSQQSSSKKLPIIQTCAAQEAPVTTISLQEYLNQELPKIMTEHEKKFGISYVSTPSIPLQLHKVCTQDQRDYLQMVGAAYNYKRNEIHLSPHFFQNSLNCACDCCFFDLDHAAIIPQKLPQLKSALDHELGHFYADTLSERLNKYDWPHFTNFACYDECDFTIFIFSEGIAEYFGRTMNNAKKDTFNDDQWPTSIAEYANILIIEPKRLYDGGYHFVRPIIDKHGARGIEYLVQYKPKEEDLFALPQLQKKMLEDLAQ